MKTISIASDYSQTPLGRYPTDGAYSGERFREEFLRPNLQEAKKLTVKIDGTEGYGSSFLEEAFGGLVRKGYFDANFLKEHLDIVANDKDFQIYRNLIWKYIEDALPPKK